MAAGDMIAVPMLWVLSVICSPWPDVTQLLSDLHLMNYIRSLLFNIFFYAGTALLVVLLSPLLILPPRVSALLGMFWGFYTSILLRVFCGITHKIRGDLRLDEQVIYAAKHQSAWETMHLCWRLNGPAIVLKKELTKIPFAGWMMSRSGAIAVDRDAGMKALKKLRKDAINAKENGRSIQIYPQGTRVAPGQKADYQIGVYTLYEATGLPVVPIALNSGECWGPRAFMKLPGVIDVSVLPAIEAGLPRKEFMARLEEAIEGEMTKLVPAQSGQ